jgi:hypothetical protein
VCRAWFIARADANCRPRLPTSISSEVDSGRVRRNPSHCAIRGNLRPHSVPRWGRTRGYWRLHG